MSALLELLERVAAATGPDRELDFLVQIHVASPLTGDEDYTLQDVMNDYAMVGAEGMTIDAPYTASVDAAIALASRVLPGWGAKVDTCGQAVLYAGGKSDWHKADAATPALAIVAALLDAKIRLSDEVE